MLAMESDLLARARPPVAAFTPRSRYLKNGRRPGTYGVTLWKPLKSFMSETMRLAVSASLCFGFEYSSMFDSSTSYVEKCHSFLRCGYCIFMPAFCTTLDHFSVSVAMSWANSAGVPPPGSTLVSAMRL